MAEDEKERIDRELKELLEELRIALPGAQVLFAFLLGVAFTQRFEDVTSTQRAVYFTALLSTAAATALLISPTSYHRIRFRERDKERMLFTANHIALAALGFIVVAIGASVFLIADVIYSTRVATLTALGTVTWFLWFWFGLPLSRRAGDGSDRHPDDGPPSA